jgi:hypothetical protein
MNDRPALTKATLTPVGGSALTVHFNPVSLEHTVSLNTKDEQFTGSGTAKVAMELIFDTTDTGVDVRSHTQKIEQMLVPAKGNDHDPKAAAKMAPPQVVFEWGAFKFQGVLESFKQTLDFWAATGIPLRAAVAVALTQPKYAFPPLSEGGAAPASVAIPGGSPFEAANAGNIPGGDPGSASRGIANANGLESLRAPALGGLVIPAASVNIGASAGFSPPGLSSIGASRDLTAGVGGSLSAGVSVGDGAFSGLHTETLRASVAMSPEKLLASLSTPLLAPGLAFDVSGRALVPDGSAFRADVRGSVQFDS